MSLYSNNISALVLQQRHDSFAPILSSLAQRRLVIRILSLKLGTLLEQQRHDYLAPTLSSVRRPRARSQQRSTAAADSGVSLSPSATSTAAPFSSGALLEQQPDDLDAPVVWSLVQWRPVVWGQCSGVPPSPSVASTAAPFSSSSLTTSTCPLSEAQCSGVPPSPSVASTAAPFSSSSLTTSTCPLSEAQCSGVPPSPSVASTATPFSSSSLTIAFIPKYTAKYNPVVFFRNLWLYPLFLNYS